MEDADINAKSSPKSFFQTLPGIITGVAAIITAVGGLILALNQTGCFGTRSSDKSLATEKSEAKSDLTSNTNDATDIKNKPADDKKVEGSSSNSRVSFSTEPISYLSAQVTFSVKDVVVQTSSGNEAFVQVKIKCVNESNVIFNWGTGGIRVKIGEDKFSPDDTSPSHLESVYPRSFKVFTFNFNLPSSEKSFSLLFYDYNDGKEVGSSPIKLI